MNNEILEKIALDLPGYEHTQLLDITSVIDNAEFSEYKAFSKHCPGMIIGAYRNENDELMIVQKNGLSHALVSGSTGCGKSYRYLATNLFALDGTTSVIVVDVKGELFKISSNYLKRIYGEQNVRVFNTIHPEQSDILFNPLYELAVRYRDAELSHEREKIEIRNMVLSELRMLTDELFVVTAEKDPTWETGARDFIYGLVVALFEDMLLTKETERSTGRIRVLPEQINFSTVADIFYSFEYNYENFDDRGFFTLREESEATRYVMGIIKNAPNTRACYIDFINRYLNPFKIPDKKNLTLTDNFNPLSLTKTPQVVFLQYDLSNQIMKSEINRFIIRAINTLKNEAISQGHPLQIPVSFLIDEFSTLTPNSIYPTIFAIGRGLNLFITAIVQDYSQLRSKYSDEVSQEIFGNSNVNIFLGSNDLTTVRMVREQIGRHAIPDPTLNLLGSMRIVETYIVSEDDLLHRMSSGDAYITINSHMPVKSFFELYFNCKEYTAYPPVQSVNGKESIIDFYDPKYHYDTSRLSRKIGTFRR